MIRRPPRSTQGVSSAASDVYKRQKQQIILLIVILHEHNRDKIDHIDSQMRIEQPTRSLELRSHYEDQFYYYQDHQHQNLQPNSIGGQFDFIYYCCVYPVSYTHLRAHETSLHLVCRLLLEKKKTNITTAAQTK
eukprot:TRINITY_DN15392_c0_g1_i1.p1 TRINITY_DN15392_c0_g1~~TRINITY_DN15392_c0_g1_i1.p1  ORF type:complete len:134 (-),score=15.68 TRINITY_DN15392_c0_g1_i1:85-486(-)